MGKPETGKQPSNRREVLRYGRKLGGKVVEGGRHTKIYNPGTGVHVSVPRHNDLSPGTLKSILSGLRLMFLALLLLATPICLTIWLIAGLRGM